MKNVMFLFAFAGSALVSFNLLAEQTLAKSNHQGQVQEKSLSEAELAQMLAPIALYPDSLLTHILIASTYPIEIVEAHRWIIKNDQLSTDKAAELVKNFDWDASVKALVPFERILSRLSEDLTWTQQLGDAFLQDESKLLESIQVLRKQAELAGNLDKMDNMDVSYEDSNIVIEPIEKEIVYVPYYDTRMVYGRWHSVSYPPVYWRPRHSVYVSRYSPFYFDSGVHISFNYFFSAFHWHNRHVVVVNSHHSKYRYYDQRPRRLIANGGYAKRWAHKPAHRKGVAYRTQNTRLKYNNNKHIKVRETSRKQHHVLQSKIQRNSKKSLLVAHHKSDKRHVSNAPIMRKKVTKPAYKKFVSVDKTKKFKTHKVTLKTYKKTATKHKAIAKSKSTSTMNKKRHTSYKNKSRTASVKKNYSKSSKTKDR